MASLLHNVTIVLLYFLFIVEFSRSDAGQEADSAVVTQQIQPQQLVFPDLLEDCPGPAAVVDSPEDNFFTTSSSDSSDQEEESVSIYSQSVSRTPVSTLAFDVLMFSRLAPQVLSTSVLCYHTLIVE